MARDPVPPRAWLLPSRAARRASSWRWRRRERDRRRELFLVRVLRVARQAPAVEDLPRHREGLVLEERLAEQPLAARGTLPQALALFAELILGLDGAAQGQLPKHFHLHDEGLLALFGVPLSFGACNGAWGCSFLLEYLQG